MPLTVPDQTIPAQVKVPDMLHTLNSIMSFKNAKLQYESESANLGEKTALRNLVNDSSVQNPDGSVNPEKYAASAIKAAPTLGATTAQGALTNQSTQISNQTNRFKLQGDQFAKSMQFAGGLSQDPAVVAASDPEAMKDPAKASQASQDIMESLSNSEDQMVASGIPKLTAKAMLSPLYTAAFHSPEKVRSMLLNVIQQGQTAGGQAGSIQPTTVDNGQQIENTNPIAAPISIQKVLPPTTPTVQGTTPGYVGAQPKDQGAQGLDVSKLSPQEIQALAAKDPVAFANGVADFQRTQNSEQKPTGGFVPSGLPVGAQNAIAGTQEQINKHWSDTQSSSNTAQQDIGVLQNIKQHAEGAATGVGADKRALADGILGLIGMGGRQLSKTDYDMLEKNSNMLALAGGDTNLAKTMAQVANPNAHMTKEAIQQAADQVIGQRKLALVRAQFLTPFKAMADQGHPEMYNNAVNQFNSVADPRVIQFKEMSPQEKSNMKSAMSPQERAEFGAKLTKARSLGIAP